MFLVEDIQNWFRTLNYAEIFREPTVRNGFIVGLALGLVLPVGLRILLWVFRRRRQKSDGIVIRGENGDLRVSVPAVREFVMRIVSEFREAALRSVYLRRQGAIEIIEVGVNAVPGTDLVSLHTNVSQRIREEAARKLGLDASRGRVNITVEHYSADESQIAKRSRNIVSERDVDKLLPSAEEEDESRKPADIAGVGGGTPLPPLS